MEYVREAFSCFIKGKKEREEGNIEGPAYSWMSFCFYKPFTFLKKEIRTKFGGSAYTRVTYFGHFFNQFLGGSAHMRVDLYASIYGRLRKKFA